MQIRKPNIVFKSKFLSLLIAYSLAVWWRDYAKYNVEFLAAVEEWM